MQENGTQTRRAIQGSGQKSQKAQLVVILQRDLLGAEGYPGPDGTLIAEEGEYSPIVKVRVDKQNIGKTGGFRQYMVGRYFTVKDMPRTETQRTMLNEDDGRPATKVETPRAYKDE
jgi:hypothetical protein